MLQSFCQFLQKRLTIYFIENGTFRNRIDIRCIFYLNIAQTPKYEALKSLNTFGFIGLFLKSIIFGTKKYIMLKKYPLITISNL